MRWYGFSDLLTSLWNAARGVRKRALGVKIGWCKRFNTKWNSLHAFKRPLFGGQKGTFTQGGALRAVELSPPPAPQRRPASRWGVPVYCTFLQLNGGQRPSSCSKQMDGSSELEQVFWWLRSLAVRHCCPSTSPKLAAIRCSDKLTCTSARPSTDWDAGFSVSRPYVPIGHRSRTQDSASWVMFSHVWCDAPLSV